MGTAAEVELNPFVHVENLSNIGKYIHAFTSVKSSIYVLINLKSYIMLIQLLTESPRQNPLTVVYAFQLPSKGFGLD